jgi:hypothetical protein
VGAKISVLPANRRFLGARIEFLHPTRPDTSGFGRKSDEATAKSRRGVRRGPGRGKRDGGVFGSPTGRWVSIMFEDFL